MDDFLIKRKQDAKILPFNSNKWKVSEVPDSKTEIEFCYSRDYMTSIYGMIPFYKPILLLPDPFKYNEK